MLQAVHRNAVIRYGWGLICFVDVTDVLVTSGFGCPETVLFGSVSEEWPAALPGKASR
jgi:hypothetical protein